MNQQPQAGTIAVNEQELLQLVASLNQLRDIIAQSPAADGNPLIPACLKVERGLSSVLD